MEIRAGKRFRSKQERLQIVEETLKPGASVSVVARAHDVNANQVFYWCKQYRQGWFGQPVASAETLLPVQISETSEKRTAPVRQIKKPINRNAAGTIEIEWN